MNAHADPDAAPPCWPAWTALGIAFLAYATTLRGGFLGDDFVYVARFYNLPWSEWPRLFTREWSDGVWGFTLIELRPFAALSFKIDATLWGGNALGWRLTNLALFLASTWHVAQLARRYTGNTTFAPLAAGLVFALHPVQVEAVAWITGRVDLLAVLAALVFWWQAEHFVDTGRPLRFAAATLALTVGVFSKELCLLTLPLLVLGWLLLPRDSANWRRRGAIVLGALGVLAFYLCCRHLAFGASATAGHAGWDSASAWQRQPGYAGWLLPRLPFTLYMGLPPQPSPGLVQIVWGIVAASAVIGAILCRLKSWPRPATFCFFAGIWWLVAVGGMLVVGYFSPRHLHFGSVGLAIAVGTLVVSRPHRFWQIGLLAAGAIWLTLAQRTALKPWRETGDVSRAALSALADAARTAPAGSCVAIAAPGQHWTAWLWAWASPALVAPPFMSPGWPADRVLSSQALLYRGDWSDHEAPRYAARIANAPAVVVFTTDHLGAIHSRTLTGTELASRAAALASLSENGLTDAEWTEWVRQSAQP